MNTKINNINQMNINMECAGCRTCEKLCPKQAISMIENEEGFLIPKIDEKKCVSCGICLQKCPQLSKNINNLINQKSYAAKIKNKETLMESSSGGVFSAIAENCLKNNGKIYGAIFDKDFNVIHIGITNIDELSKLRGSKYVQSDTLNTYNEVKQDLNNNIKVVYSGTPCQIAGLKSFLGKDYENLLTVDLVCHGVPSPKIFKKYKDFLEKKLKSEIASFSFRDKEKRGWGENLRIAFKNGKKLKIFGFLDPYYKTFLEGNLSRECCYNCKYANSSRIGDITLADFWGIYNEYPNFYDKNGVSAVIVNTKKGTAIWNSIKENLNFMEVELSKIQKHNHNLEAPTMQKEIRKDIYKDINYKDFKQIYKDNFKFKTTLKARIRSKFTDGDIEKIKSGFKKLNKKRKD